MSSPKPVPFLEEKALFVLVYPSFLLTPSPTYHACPGGPQ